MSDLAAGFGRLRVCNDELCANFIGRSIADCEHMLSQAFGANYPQFKSRRRQLWQQHVQEIGIELKAGLRELLDYLDEQLLLKAVATSTHRNDALLCLGHLSSRFDEIVTGDEVQYGKPAPDIFLLAAQRLMLAPEQCLVLEDSEAGGQAALAASMNVIIVPDLKQPPALLATQVHRVCTSLHEVKQLFTVELFKTL